MDRWELARALAFSPRVRHLLLLTATPHNGYTDSFASLLRMLDVGAVTGPLHAPRIIRPVARRHVCQRRRKDVEVWFQSDPDRSPFPKRDQQEVIVAPSSYEIDAIRAVEEYGRRVLEQAAAEPIQVRSLAHWTVLHLHKRALSSPEALRCSLRNRRERLKRRLRGDASEVEEIPILPEVARANVLDEDTGERLTDEEAGERTERAVYGSTAQIREELALLEQVLTKAEKITPRRDSKLQKLLDVVLRDLLRADPRVVVFTRYRDTMNYLADQIQRDRRYADVTVLTIHGGLNERQRREVFHAFERADKSILIATDAISEGINLQHAAAQVVHYELPWNPNRLEQRNGRVDRFGQRKRVVTIRTMVIDETPDATILKVLVQKAARIREDYGFAPGSFDLLAVTLLYPAWSPLAVCSHVMYNVTTTIKGDRDDYSRCSGVKSTVECLPAAGEGRGHDRHHRARAARRPDRANCRLARGADEGLDRSGDDRLERAHVAPAGSGRPHPR